MAARSFRNFSKPISARHHRSAGIQTSSDTIGARVRSFFVAVIFSVLLPLIMASGSFVVSSTAALASTSCVYSHTVAGNSGLNELNFAKDEIGIAADSCTEFARPADATGTSGKGTWSLRQASTPDTNIDNEIDYTPNPGATGDDIFMVPFVEDGVFISTLTVTITITPPPAPTISGVSPSSGPTGGGTSVTLSGTNLTGATGVQFGATAATSVVVTNATTMTATAPAHSGGTVDVTVTTGGGTSATSTNDQFTYQPAATTTALAVSTATPSFGTTITLTATIAGGASPTGLVTFKDGATTLGDVPLTGTTATLSTSALSVGTHSITAAYGGDTNNGTSTSSVTVTVSGILAATQAVPSTTLTQNRATLFTPVTASGGTGTLSYAVSPSLPAGLSLAATTGEITGMPSVTSAATTYTVTVTDSASATATATFGLTVNGAVVATQAVAASTLTVGHAATSFTPVTGSGGTGTLGYTISPSITGLGLSFDAATGAVSGTPTTASGPASYTVTVTDSNGATASASFSLTVSGPVAASVAIGSTSLTKDRVANSFTPVTGSGGTAPLTFAVSPSLPAGLSLATSTGTITGTPSALSASSSYVVTVTDANGVTANANFNLAVLIATPTAGSVAVHVQTNASNAPIALSLGGGPATSVAVASAPAHGTATATGTAISYTPNAGYSGMDSFSYTATNGSGTSAAATVIITIDAVTITFNPAAGPLTQAMVGEAYDGQITATGGIGATTYAVTSGALPGGLVLNQTTGALTGPLHTDVVAGTFAFTITATDGNGSAGSAAYSLVVVTRAVTAKSDTIAVVPGTPPAPVDLIAGATGGPFVAAQIEGSVEPPNAGTATIQDQRVASLAPTPMQFYLKFTPNPAYIGTATVHYRLTSLLGSSNSASITFTTNQIDPAGVAQNIDTLAKDFVSMRQGLIDSAISVPGLIERRHMGSGSQPGVINVSPAGDGLTLNFASSLADLKAWGEAGNAAQALATAPPKAQPFNVWIDGTATVHFGAESGTDHWGNFGMLSGGADYLVNDQLLIGLATHIDMTTDLTDASNIKGTGVLAGPYVSAEIAKNLYLDASLDLGHSPLSCSSIWSSCSR
jgi:hypothetical protein